jgi:hypothetical protein
MLIVAVRLYPQGLEVILDAIKDVAWNVHQLSEALVLLRHRVDHDFHGREIVLVLELVGQEIVETTRYLLELISS